MFKKIGLTFLIVLFQAVSVFAIDLDEIKAINSNPDYTKYLNVYGTGLKLGDKAYSGAGFQFEDDYTNLGAEFGDDYTKAFLSRKFNISPMLYLKAGGGYLTIEKNIQGTDKYVDQYTGGASLGYGDNKTYNLEFGYIANKLKGAAFADTTTKTYFVESVLKKEFEYGVIDVVGMYQNSEAYGKHYDEYSVSAGYYPTDDTKLCYEYSSIKSDDDNYYIKAGFTYKFASFEAFEDGEFSPYINVNKNTSKNSSFCITYQKDIAKKPLQVRDVFEDKISTATIVAEQVAPDKFYERSQQVSSSSDTNGPVVDDAAYSTTDLTNEDVTVTFVAKEDIDAPAGWTKSDNRDGTWNFIKVYSSNFAGYITFTDVSGNETQKWVIVGNIDKTSPPAPYAFNLNSGDATTTTTTVSLNGFGYAGEGISGYFVSESATKPDKNAAGWSAYSPSTYTFSNATLEIKTVYGYVKDLAGNVSDSSSDSIELIAP